MREARAREDQLREDQLREGRLRQREDQPHELEARPAQRTFQEPAPAIAAAPATDTAPASTPAFEPPPATPVAVQAQPAPERAPERRAPPPPPPQIDVDSALRASGLVMIETSREKAQSVAPVEEVQVPRARRERRPPPADLDAPLQQVETRKGDGESPPH